MKLNTVSKIIEIVSRKHAVDNVSLFFEKSVLPALAAGITEGVYWKLVNLGLYIYPMDNPLELLQELAETPEDSCYNESDRLIKQLAQLNSTSHISGISVDIIKTLIEEKLASEDDHFVMVNEAVMDMLNNRQEPDSYNTIGSYTLAYYFTTNSGGIVYIIGSKYYSNWKYKYLTDAG